MPVPPDQTCRACAEQFLRRLPGPVSPRWPLGERFVRALAHGTLSVVLYAPRGTDPQPPHLQDQLYFIRAGTGCW